MKTNGVRLVEGGAWHKKIEELHMSDRSTIAAEPRSVTGKKVKQLRRDGFIPAVIYGQSEAVHVQLENLPLRRVLREAGSTSLIELELDGSSRTVLARHIQIHPTRGDLFHVDFYEVNMRQVLTSEAVLVATGESPAAEDGEGSAVLVVHTVQIEALPDDLISELEVDISRIEAPEDVLHVSDLAAPRGVTILADPETVIAKFEYAQLEEEEEEEEVEAPEADEVEVITKGRHEEEADSAETETDE
jgi:large subunit ribosomal protein L25